MHMPRDQLPLRARFWRCPTAQSLWRMKALEQDLYLGVLRYCEQFDGSKRTECFEKLLPQIRFSFLPPEYLEEIEVDEQFKDVTIVHKILYETYRFRAYPSATRDESFIISTKPRQGMVAFSDECCDTSVKVSSDKLTATSTGTNGNWVNARCLIPVQANGYIAMKCKFTSYTMFGFETKDCRNRKTANTYAGAQVGGYQWYSAAYVYSAGSSRYITGEHFYTGDVVGMYFDLNNGKVKFYRNGKATGVEVTGLTDKEYYPVITFYSGGDSATVVQDSLPTDLGDSSSKSSNKKSWKKKK